MNWNHFALVAALAMGCGNESEGNNGGAGAGNNGMNNGGSNNGTAGNNGGSNNGTAGNNGGSNNGTAGNNGGSGDGGTATIDWTITVGDRSTTMTECSFDTGTASMIIMAAGVGEGEKLATLNCKKQEDGSDTAVFTAKIQVHSAAAGQTLAGGDLAFSPISGNVGVELYYQDGLAGINDGARSAISTNAGSVTIDTFDTATGEFAGSIDLTITSGDLEASLVGSFSANLFDCTGAAVGCNGQGG